MSKQIAGPTATKDHPVSIICDIFGSSFCNVSMDIFPIISLAMVTCIVFKLITYAVHQRFLKYFIMSGTILSYAFIANHWASESTLLSHTKAVQDIGRSWAPRFVYAIGGLSLVISVLWRLFAPVDSLKFNKRITSLSAAMLCSWSPTILMLLGRQGAFVALICITGGTLQVTQFLRQALLKFGMYCLRHNLSLFFSFYIIIRKHSIWKF